MKTIYLKLFRFQGKARIAILFNYEKSIIEKVRLIPGRIWSVENRLWHIPYTKEKLKSLKFYLTSVDIKIDDSAFRVKECNAKYSTSQIVSKLELPKVHEAHIDRFRVWLKSKRYSERTCATYVGLIKSFLTFFNTNCIEDITNEDIILFNDQFIVRNHYSISYQRQMVSAIKLFYQQIAHRKLDIDQLERPRREKKLPTIFSKEEVGKIIRALRNEKHRVIISLIYSAGLRVSELLNLMPEDIDSDRMVIHIRSGKGRNDKIVPLSKILVNSLRDYYKHYHPKVYIFEGKGGR